MDIVRVGRQTLRHFELLITAEGLEQISTKPGSSMVLGAIVDGIPVGAAVVSVEPPVARMSYLYVEDAFRRQGIGSALCGRMVNEIVVNTDLDSLVVPFAEEADGDVFKSFFECLYFVVEKVGADNIITVGDALMYLRKNKIGKVSSKAIACNKLRTVEKKLLYELDTDLSGYIAKSQIREDLSFVILNDSQTAIEKCIIFAEVGGELVLAWAQSDGFSPEFMKLVGNSMLVLEEKEPFTKRLHLPSISDESAEFIVKLFGRRSKPGKVSYMAYF